MIEIKWEDGSYCTYQDDQFIADHEDIMGAITFALAVAEHSGEDVIIRSIDR